MNKPIYNQTITKKWRWWMLSFMIPVTLLEQFWLAIIIVGHFKFGIHFACWQWPLHIVGNILWVYNWIMWITKPITTEYCNTCKKESQMNHLHLKFPEYDNIQHVWESTVKDRFELI